MPRVVLGRGLSALIPNKSKDKVALKRISISKISPNENQPREFIEGASFEELKESVRHFGVLQPLIVKEKADGEDESYELVAGERRYQAAKAVGLQELPVVVKKVKSEIEGFEIALIENIQREDLNPLEEARAFRYLLDDCNISQDKLAKQLGKSRSYIANCVRLLNLDEAVQKLISDGSLSAGQARTLITFEKVQQRLLAKRALEQGLSVRQLENITTEKKNSANYRKVSDDYSKLEQELSQEIGAQVRIKSWNNKGRIEIYFASRKELKRTVGSLRAPKGRGNLR